jgi:hypothetical protein
VTTVIDTSTAAIILLSLACIYLAIYAFEQRQHARRQQIRGDECWMWAEHHRDEADAAQRRVHVLERRYANLQSMYAELVRRRIAANTSLIARNANKENSHHDRRN